MSWLQRLDTAASRASWPLKAAYHSLKWALVALGAAGVIYNTQRKWGTPAALWFLLAPVAYGLWRGLTGPPSTPRPR